MRLAFVRWKNSIALKQSFEARKCARLRMRGKRAFVPHPEVSTKWASKGVFQRVKNQPVYEFKGWLALKETAA